MRFRRVWAKGAVHRVLASKSKSNPSTIAVRKGRLELVVLGPKRFHTLVAAAIAAWVEGKPPST